MTTLAKLHIEVLRVTREADTALVNVIEEAAKNLRPEIAAHFHRHAGDIRDEISGVNQVIASLEQEANKPK